MLNLREAVETVCAIAQSSTAYPTANLVQIRGDGSRCVVSAFDGFKTAHAFAVDSFKGTANVDGKQLARALAKIVDARISVSGDRLTVSGNGKLTMPSLPNEIAKPLDVEGVQVNAAAFRAAIKRVQHAVSPDTTRPHVHAVSVEASGMFAATDGHRVSIVKGPDGIAMLLPAWWIPMVLATKGETLTISVTDRQLAICDGDVTMVSPAVNATFPPYRQIVPKEFASECRASKAKLLEALTVAELSGENAVRLAAADGSLVVDSQDAKSGSMASATIDCDGDVPEIGMSIPYLRDAVNFVDGDTVIISTTKDALGPVVFRGADEHALTVVMPTKLDTRTPRGGKKK